LCGDGEIQEGQIWEAAMFGNKYKLDNVIAFVDRNYMQTDGYSENIMPMDPLLPKWQAFGWEAFQIDGHDFEEIVNTVNCAKKRSGKPTMIITRTVKGKGVPFMEDDPIWHALPPSREQYERSIQELENGV
jgi:transketolase